MRKSIIFCAVLGIITFSNSSCNKFLEVNPKSSISDRELFSSQEGFDQALTGIYSIMNSRALYGDKLTMGFASALAYNYSTATPAFILDNSSKLKIESGEVTGHLNSIWTTGYNAINGINNILDQIDNNKAIFSDNNYALIKGEALGLRALMHFDLVRLFGENYSKTSTKLAIPYRIIFAPNPVPPVTTAKVLEAVLHDLNEAEKLLQGADPIKQHPQQRRFNMNYYAVKALQARAYLYMEEKAKAIEAAKVVIESEAFRFIDSRTELSVTATRKDRLFSMELVFALRNSKMKDWVETSNPYFRFGSNISQTGLTQPDANFALLYDNIATDIRRAYLFENDQSKIFPSKYWQTFVLASGADPATRLDQCVPLIRWTEMFYIIAEASPTAQEGVVYLNKVRVARALEPLNPATITPATLTTEIQKEYQKEFYAEGQTFFYYKRMNIAKRLFAGGDASLATYLFPIPDDELEFNNNFN